MVNYNDGKIYKIEPICVHDECDIYIGSTTKKYLSQRMDNHRCDYKRWKDCKCNKVTVYDIFDKYGVENCQIILIELVNASSKDELYAREKHHIKTLSCVNKVIIGRTRTEYLQDNKEHTAQRNKVYYDNNKTHIVEMSVNYYNNNKEAILEARKEYYDKNKEILNERNKQYNINNKDKISEYKNNDILCECGVYTTPTNKSRHIKTKKHLKSIENQLLVK